MKKGKIVLSASALLMSFIGSLAFAGDSKKRFGQGTLFIQQPTNCVAVNCARVQTGNFCADVTYYTTKTGTVCSNEITVRPRVVAQ